MLRQQREQKQKAQMPSGIKQRDIYHPDSQHMKRESKYEKGK